MNRYPTDEELNRFIEELEKEELYAPRHLKEEILLKAAKTEQMHKSESKRSQPVQMFTYTLKIVAGMAAAIFLVFMIPANYGNNAYEAEQVRMEQTQKQDWEKEKGIREEAEDGLGFRLNDSARRINAAANDLFNKINHTLNKNDIGGKNNEN